MKSSFPHLQQMILRRSGKLILIQLEDGKQNAETCEFHDALLETNQA